MAEIERELMSDFKRYTITLPNGEAFDAYIANLYEPHWRMNHLVERAGAKAYVVDVDEVLLPIERSVEQEFSRAAAMLRRLRLTLDESGEGNRLDDALDIFDEVHQQFGG